MTSCCCIDVDDPCSVSTKTKRKARKEHKCCECYRKIPVGASHWYETALHDGHWTAYRTCELCMSVRDDLFECGFYWGGLWECVWDCMRDGYDDEPNAWLEKPTHPIVVKP